MTLPAPSSRAPITRRRFLTAAACAAGGFALYAGEFERHWIGITRRDVLIPGLPHAFDGFRIAQLSDIHLNEFTEPFLLRDAINCIDGMNPDIVALTGDFITRSPITRRIFHSSEWECAEILSHLKCPFRYACLGNHDVMVGINKVTKALTANGIAVLNNAHLPIERDGARFWLAGLEDPLSGHPNPEAAIPASIRNLPGEPVILLCHGPDYVDNLLTHPSGHAVALMLAGHTHGGQIRVPLMGPIRLPPMGKKYVEGWFRFGSLQLHVNRGIGTVDLPFRFNCPPEISLLTLRPA